MPLYEYQCDACGHRFEVIQKFSDAPVETCTACGGAVRKLLSSPAIQFKGSGWYITDYARKSSGGKGADASTKTGGSGGDSGAGTSSGEKSSGETSGGDKKSDSASTSTPPAAPKAAS